MDELIQSHIKRKNILNNEFALYEIQNQMNIDAIVYDDMIIFTKDMVAKYFEVDIRTVERYIEENKKELEENGYMVLRGEPLKILKNQLIYQFGTDIYVGTKTTVLAVFNFKSFLNMAMLISESPKAKELRSVMLNIVIDVINKKAGGSTKYINQRDEDFLTAWFSEENYRKEFTDVLDKYVDMGNVKYAIYTNRIYVNIFKEKADEYRKILRLKDKDRIRDTMYAEVLDLIASYEVGLAYDIRTKSDELGRKLRGSEVDDVIKKFHNHPSRKPLLLKARSKMASRDLVFRDALHLHLQEYIAPLDRKEYERFLGEKSKELEERLEEAQDVFKRLKEY